MQDFAKTALERFEALLRTFMPGCIVLGVLLLNGQRTKLEAALGTGEATWMLATFVIGIVLYAVHYTALEYVFTVIAIFIAKKWYRPLLPESVVKMPSRHLRHWLTRERWARPASKRLVVVSHQAHLKAEYSWLVFTYCTSYALLVSVAALSVLEPSAPANLWLVGAAVAAAAMGLLADVDVTRKEIWLNLRYPQLPPEA